MYIHVVKRSHIKGFFILSLIKKKKHLLLLYFMTQKYLHDLKSKKKKILCKSLESRNGNN